VCSISFTYPSDHQLSQISSLYLRFVYYCFETVHTLDGKPYAELECRINTQLQTGFLRTNSLLNTLILYTICTGMLTGYLELFICAQPALRPNLGSTQSFSLLLWVSISHTSAPEVDIRWARAQYATLPKHAIFAALYASFGKSMWILCSDF